MKNKYIDADLLKKYLKELQENYQFVTYEGLYYLIEHLQQEQPEYGYLSTTYIYGKRPRWNVGDTIAYYLCTSDEEGEIIIGKITKVEFSNEEGWVYTFEDESTWDEQSLAEEAVYKIIENGK